ncbi:MAG: 3-phosphoshikimate 1-carboxyvinyltransferase [Bacteroidales bacterium]|nr:3-phosphoshikimate 1-carboxyvinyltransferase [Bacteroidales bacterium]
MICLSIQKKDLGEILGILSRADVEMAEIRLDRCPLSIEEIEELFSGSDTPLVATCRINEVYEALCREGSGLDDRELQLNAYSLVQEKLVAAARAGAQYVDLEIEAPPSVSRKVRRVCQESGTLLIRSFHDFTGTPSGEELRCTIDKCRAFGADVVKIVTTAASAEDAATVMSLYGENAPGSLVAFCMGEEGRRTRIDCLKEGSPFTYCSAGDGEETAPGQWTLEEMTEAVYGRERKTTGAEPLVMPSSKSFAQRAIIAAALADGESVLRGYSPCGDNESAIAVARAIGAEISCEGSVLKIKGIGAAPGSLSLDTLHVGESGFLARMMIPLMAALNGKSCLITGEKTLPNRPLKGAEEIMMSFGVRLSGNKVPLTVSGSLVNGKAEISGKDGSQLISGLLAALPLGDRNSTVYVTDPRSIPYMFITVDVLKRFGIRIGSEMEGGEDFLSTGDWSLCTGISFRIKGGQRYKAADFSIEGDWSSAANFLVAGAVFGRCGLEGLDTGSLQADLSIMDILAQAGASLSQEGEDHRGLIHVQKAPLSAFDTDANNCPDLFPIISVLAAFCEGESHIAGVGRLASKESDRGQAILSMLTQMGVKASIDRDILTVEGMPLTRRILTGNLLRGGSYTSNHDHRMVMALKVASLGASSPITIDDTECVAKSFPSFLSLFERFSA